MLEAVGGPEGSFRSLHVGGTNGKGSVTACAAAVLEASGRSAGRYLSPHVADFGERIQLNGAAVDPSLLGRCARRLLPEADRVEASRFEALTALAFLSMAEAGAEWVVAEVGMGGRLDSTNVLTPKACAISSVAVDHEEHLGESLREVAAEKAGILKEGVPAVVGAMPVMAGRVVEERARRCRAPLHRWGRDVCVREVETALDGTRFRYESRRRPRGLHLSAPLAGRHQARNAAVALALLEVSGTAPGEDAIRRGLAAVRHPGRLQVLPDGGCLLLLDIAHNPAALDAVLEALDDLDAPPPRVALVSMLRDKPWRRMLRRLLRELEAVVCTSSDSAPEERRWSLERTEALGQWGRMETRAEPDAGLERARELADGGTVLVTGSTYLVRDVLRERTEADRPDQRAGGLTERRRGDTP